MADTRPVYDLVLPVGGASLASTYWAVSSAGTDSSRSRFHPRSRDVPGEGASEAPKDRMGGVGPITFRHGLGVAGQDE